MMLLVLALIGIALDLPHEFIAGLIAIFLLKDFA